MNNKAITGFENIKLKHAKLHCMYEQNKTKKKKKKTKKKKKKKHTQQFAAIHVALRF